MSTSRYICFHAGIDYVQIPVTQKAFNTLVIEYKTLRIQTQHLTDEHSWEFYQVLTPQELLEYKGPRVADNRTNKPKEF